MDDKPIDVLLESIERGHITFPYILLTGYRKAGLSDQDAMVILQVFAYQQIENAFPSLDELVARMALTKEEVATILQRLFAQGLLSEAGHGVSWRPFLMHLVGLTTRDQTAQTVFTRFEEEFGRLLSPLEYEQIIRWMNQDNHPEWLVVEALRESVLAGVYNFRYVDSILRDWMRARIGTPGQLEEYRGRHRTRPDGTAMKQSGRSPGSTRAGAPRRDSGADRAAGDRVVPAAQPGKYDGFYKVFQGQSEKSALDDGSSR